MNKQLAGIVVFLIGLVGYFPAQAGSPDNRSNVPETYWFQQLARNDPQYGKLFCCSIADCHLIAPGDIRVRNNHYEFKMEPDAWGSQADHQWHVIPNRILIRGPELAALGGNPTGSFVICSNAAPPAVFGRGGFRIYCAVPAGGY